MNGGPEAEVAFRRISFVASVFLLVASPRLAPASCDQIPGAVEAFRAAQGGVDRPFAGPEDFVTVDLAGGCTVSPGFSERPDDHVVTLVFRPPSGIRNVVVIAADCEALEERRADCADLPSIASVSCQGAGDPIDVLRSGAGGALRFRFPDTDELLAPDGDGRGFTGPVAIAITSADAPLPCGLAAGGCGGIGDTLACVDRLYATASGCDPVANEILSHFTALPPANGFRDLCTTVGSECTGRAAEVRMTLDAKGNLLLPMDWSGVLLGERVPFARLVRAGSSVEAFPGAGEPIRLPNQGFLRSLSLGGGLLPALFEARLDASATSELSLFGAADAPRTILWIGRRSPGLTSCDGGGNDRRPCTAPGDCPGGLCAESTCGADPAAPACRSDAECDGECGPGLFDFSSRLDRGVGPILIPRFGPGVCEDGGAPCDADADCNGSRCVTYRLSTEDPVLIDGVLDTESLRATVVPEGIAAADLNGDGDLADEVVLLSDRKTGAAIPIGVETDAGRAAGRAATLIRDGPFRQPAVVVDADLLAFLEAEPLQWPNDRNGDGDRFDAFLRVFRRDAELTPSDPVAADGAPLVNGNAIAIGRGRVFFRAVEAASARRQMVRVSSAPSGRAAAGTSHAPHLTRDGSAVAFESDAGDLTDEGSDGRDHVFLHDVDSGETRRIRIDYGDVADPNAPAASPWFSADGRFLAFAAPDTRGFSQIWIHDRDHDADGVFDAPDATATILGTPSVWTDGPAEGDTFFPTVDRHGAVLAYASRAPDIRREGSDRVFLTYWRDRDTNGDGVFDEERFRSANLVSERAGVEAGLHSILQPAPVSDNGRFTAFASYAEDLVPGDTNEVCLNFFPDDQSSSNCADVFLFDYMRGRQQRVSVGNRGQQGDQASLTPALSADGRHVAFYSFAGNLVPGDTNGSADLFLRDVRRATTARLSVSSAGEEGNGPSYDQSLSISADSRFVAFTSSASNLAPRDANFLCDNDLDGTATENCPDVFVHDRFTGFTERVSVGGDGREGNGRSSHPVLSGDGAVIAFQSRASNLVAGDDNDLCDTDLDGAADDNCTDVFLVRPDPADVALADLSGDGDLNDAVLRVFDSTSGRLQTLCPADQVVVRGNVVVFLRPEAAGPARGCPAGVTLPAGVDLNGDGDAEDLVVHLWAGQGEAENLELSASRIAASETWIAALVPDALASRGPVVGSDNGPVRRLFVRPAVGVPGSWTALGELADEVQVMGSRIAFTSPEIVISPRDPDIRTRDITGNGEHSDTSGESIPRLYEADRDLLLPYFLNLATDTPLAASAFVLGRRLLAFSSQEIAQPGWDVNDADCDFNEDGDCRDDVLFVYDIERELLHNTGQAVTPCPIEVCDPSLPFVVLDHTVRFLTLESEQGEDLDGDEELDDVVVQTFNAEAAAVSPPANPLRAQRTTRLGAGVLAAPLTTIGDIEAGLCTSSAAACFDAGDCPSGGECHVPPGDCVVETADACSPSAAERQCDGDAFCVPADDPGSGTCRRKLGRCSTDDDCDFPARCVDRGIAAQRSVNPLLATDAGALLFATAGQCARDLGVPCTADGQTPCPPGTSCAAPGGKRVAGSCKRFLGSCRSAADCPDGFPCEPSLILVSAADRDGDEVVDAFDNCAALANPPQVDSDGDGIGDACQQGTASPSAPPRRTSTPSPTTAETRTTEPTATVSATASSTPSGTAPRPAGGDDDGCQVGGASSGGLWSLALPLALWLLGRTRARLPLLVVGAVALWWSIAPAPAQDFAPCPGDCDGDRALTVDELVAGVLIASGAGPVGSCPSLDADRSRAVEIRELVGAVERAINGCPARIDPDALGVLLVTIRAMDAASSVLLESLQFFNGTAAGAAFVLPAGPATGGGAGNCPRGGTDERTCEVLDDGLVRIPYVLDRCTYRSAATLVTLEGRTALIGTGSCPGLFLPSAARFEIDQTVTVREARILGRTLSESRVKLAGVVRSVELAGATCALEGTELRFAGGFVVDDGDLSSLDVDRAEIVAAFGGLPCRPEKSVLRLDGPASVNEESATASLEFDLRSADLAVTREVTPSGVVELSVEGTVHAPGAGGAFSVATLEPLTLDAGCPRSGALMLVSRGASAVARFAADASVSVDLEGDGGIDRMYASCARLTASPGVLESGDP